MDELVSPRFHPSDRVRYVRGFRLEGWGGGEKAVLLKSGMVGKVVRGPELRRNTQKGTVWAVYYVSFGLTVLAVRSERLERT